MRARGYQGLESPVLVTVVLLVGLLDQAATGRAGPGVLGLCLVHPLLHANLIQWANALR